MVNVANQPGYVVEHPPEFGFPAQYILANNTVLAGPTIFEDTASLSLFLLKDGQSDQLSIQDGIQLGGTLNLTLGAAEFFPELGESWEILIGKGIAGQFDSINSDAPAGWDWQIDYYDDRVILSSIASPVPLPASGLLLGSGLLWLFRRARVAELNLVS